MDEDGRLYLQFLQNNIARMNSNSVHTKEWCITIVIALLTLYSLIQMGIILFISSITIIVFCILDALYLQQEYKFIAIYNDYLSSNNNRPKVYQMPINKYEIGLLGFLKALKSWSVLLVYPVLLVICGLLYWKEILIGSGFCNSFFN